jgi:hypothetical protein
MAIIVVHAPDYPTYRFETREIEEKGYSFVDRYFTKVLDVQDRSKPDEATQYPGVFSVMTFSTPIPSGKIFTDKITEYRFSKSLSDWSADGVTPAPPVIGALYNCHYPIGGEIQ